MTSQDEKNRPKELNRARRERQREQVKAAFPATALELKKLFYFIDQQLDESECDDTLQFATQYIRASGLDEGKVIEWLEENGGYCDCEALANVEELVSEAVL